MTGPGPVDPAITALSYELERTRARVRRVTRQQGRELELALEALDRGRPHVTVSRIEIAIEALARLRDEVTS